MTHALESYNGTISIGGCKITNLRFADGNDGITGEEDELKKFEQNLDTAATQLGLALVSGLGLVWCYDQGKFRVRVRIRVRVGFGWGL